MLPPGEWHCPNCTCKFCGLAGEDDAEGDDTTTSALLPCSMCEKKCTLSLSLVLDSHCCRLLIEFHLFVFILSVSF